MTLALPTLAFVVVAIAVSQSKMQQDWLMVVIGAAIFVFFGAIAAAIYSTMRDYEQRRKELDFQVDLLELPVCPRETRAEKVLRVHSANLQRYYDLNLRQNVLVLVMGVLCLAVWVSFIGVAMNLVQNCPAPARIMTVILGSVGALLTNFIGVIYLRMHAAAVSNLGSFHARLCRTNQTLFGILIASRIDDDNLRWQTWSELAIAVANQPIESNRNGADSSKARFSVRRNSNREKVSLAEAEKSASV